MTFLSRKADYALLILSYLGRHPEGGSARGIAAEFELSRAFVANILKELHQAGLVSSSRGAKGGYGLQPRALDLSLSELLEAVKEGFRLTVCSDHGHGPEGEACSLSESCPVKNPLAEIHRRITAVLSGVSLRELLTPPATSPAPPQLLRLEILAPRTASVPPGAAESLAPFVLE